MTSPAPSWLICMSVGATGSEYGGATLRTPDCAVIRLGPELIANVAKSVAAARLVDAASAITEVRSSMPVAIGLFQGVPIERGCLSDKVMALGWLKPGEQVDHVDDELRLNHSIDVDDEDDEGYDGCQEWESMRDECENQVMVFNPSSHWLKVDQDTFTVNVWDKHGDDELHVRVHMKAIPGLLAQVEEAVQSTYASWGIPEALRPVANADEAPPQRERARG